MSNDHELEAFISDFTDVKELGFRESHRSNNTGIGKTYEDLLGVAENNLKEPDLHGFEIKSQRAYTGSYVTLFTKSPTMPLRANAYLKDNFGSDDALFPDVKVLHTSVFCDRFNTHKSGFNFSLRVDEQQRRLYLIVADPIDKSTFEDCYWTFDILEKCLITKLSRLAFVSAETRINANGKEEFHFNSAKIFSGLKPFQVFIELLKAGKIMFDIRIGAYKSGTRKGKPHDHGSGFRIRKQDMASLYESVIDIN